MRLIGVLLLWLSVAATVSASAQSLDELLRQVERQQQAEAQANQAREALFVGSRDRQQQMLAEAKAQLAAAQSQSVLLREQFDANEQLLAEQNTVLRQRLGDLSSLFVTARQVAGDTAGLLDHSLVSVQIPGRSETLLAIADSDRALSLSALKSLWYLLLQEMTESARVVQFTTGVIGIDGRETQRQVVRVGAFTMFSEGQFLRYDGAASGQLIEMPRQPATRYQSVAAALQQTDQAYAAMPIDPTGGQMLAALVQTPTLLERVQQGKLVGYVIIVLALLGLGLGLVRWWTLTVTGKKVSSQRQAADMPASDNPLGRVLSVYDSAAAVDTETLERKLDAAIIRELPALNRGLSVLKILAVTAPLLGLLGTVTGMIETFQSITLFGTGDPKLMAGGISQALMTTVLGLMAAIPLTFLHALVSSRSRAITQILEEQSAGVIARHAESHA